MAMTAGVKKSETTTAAKQIADAVDKVAENDKPFLKQDSNEELSILGDPTKIEKDDNETLYTVEFVLPKDEFDVTDFDPKCVQDGDTHFHFTTTATQEKIRPNDRAGFMVAAASVLQHFFVVKGDGVEMLDGDELNDAALNYYLNPVVVGATKQFVGRMLGIDKKLIPYFAEDEVVKTAIDLIAKNPSVVNESYFTSRRR